MCCEAADARYYLQLALDWVPFLIFIGLLFYFTRKLSRSQKPHTERMTQYWTEHLAETKKIGANLERIAAALEK
ncbi:MAG TPA: hypothetical protein VF132_09475, partial [Rudaea sp.]